MFTIRAEQYTALRRKKIGDALIRKIPAAAGKAEWDERALSVALTDGDGNRSYFGFDSLGFLDRYTSPLGRTWQLTNSADGKLLTLASPSGHRTELRYNELGLIEVAASTSVAPVKLEYTPLRQPAMIRYGDGTVDAVEYTPWNAPLRVVDRNGLQNTCAYDKHRRLTALADGNAHVTQFDYGVWDRPDAAYFPNGTFESYLYDKRGRLCELLQGEDVDAEVTMDEANRPLSLRYGDGTELEYAYNDAGLPTAARQGDDAIAMEYNERGQLTQETAGGQKRTFLYNAAGGLVGLQSGDRVVEFAWDADARLIGFTDWNGGEHRIVYAEADGGMLLTAPNGTQTLTLLQPDGNVRAVEVSAGGAPLYSMSCAYDGEARVVGLADSVFGNRSYSYNPGGQLVRASGAQDEVFGYDGAGNIKSLRGLHAQYDAANQLMDTGQEGLRYDSRGNLVARTGVFGNWAFRYNDRNQMILSVAPSGTETVYAYDAFGRRTLKRTGEVETRFEWAGEWMIGEETRNLATGAVSRQEYLYHPETHVPLATSIDGVVYSYHTDHLGTPRAMTGPDGAMVWLADYAAFGGATIAVEQARNPLRLLGQYFDPETGLHYNRFRYYSPHWGRYITRDLLSFRAGLNVYAYAGGDPINKTDRLGLSFWGVVAGVAVGVAAVAVVILAGPEILVAAAVEAAVGAVAGGLIEAGSEYLNGQPLSTSCILTEAAISAGVSLITFGAGLLAKEVVSSLRTAATPLVEKEFAEQAANVVPKRPYAPPHDLPRDAGGNFTPDPNAQGAHTVLGTKAQGSAGPYRRAMSFDEQGRPTGRYDFTDHGRPQNHPDPHYHPIDPNTGKVGGAQPMPQW